MQWQIFQIQQFCIHTQCSVILACHWWYKLFIHWWTKGIYFAGFYFRVWDLTREICKNKNQVKISTYTVIVLHQVRMSRTSTAVSAWRLTSVKHCTAREDRGPICLTFVFACVVGKNQRPPIWIPWLTTPIHRAVYEVLDLPYGLTLLNRRSLQPVQGLYCLLNLARLPYP